MAGEFYVPLLTKGRLSHLAQTPIAAFVGFNGMGKTMGAVAAAMHHLEAGRPVLSTVRLLDYRNPRPCEDAGCLSVEHGMEGHRHAHPLWIPFTDFRQLFDFGKGGSLAPDGGHVLMDEVTGVADAREHASMPVQVANYLPQMRRRDVTLAWTTIAWTFADVRLRRLTLSATWAVGMAPKYSGDTMWPSNRVFYYRTYNASDLKDDFHSAKRDDLKPLNRAWFRRGPSLVQNAYASGDQVLTLGAANDAGMCLSCGGKRALPKCRCVGSAEDAGDAVTERPARRRVRVPAPQRSEEPGAPDDGTTGPAPSDDDLAGLRAALASPVLPAEGVGWAEDGPTLLTVVPDLTPASSNA